MKAYRPTVSLDIDGVLADFCWGAMQIAVQLGLADKPWKTAQQPTWEFPFDTEAVWDTIDASRNFWENLETKFTEDDLDAIEALADEANIIYVTSRSGPDNVMAQTLRWLSDAGLPEGPVFMPGKDKSVVLKPLKENLLAHIDDSPAVLVRLAECHLPVTAFDAPYNRSITHVPRVGSIAGWIERLGVQKKLTYSVGVGWQPPMDLFDTLSDGNEEDDDGVS